MIGQPTETMEDVEAIPDLACRLLERLRVPGPDGHPFGKLTLSVSSFVPKPWTPFQWAPCDEPRDLETKLEAIKGGARRLQVRVVHENPREAGLQALLARGDRRVADFVEIAARLDGGWSRGLVARGAKNERCRARGETPGAGGAGAGMSRRVFVGQAAEVPVGEGRVVEVEGKALPLLYVGRGVHALDKALWHR